VSLASTPREPLATASTDRRSVAKVATIAALSGLLLGVGVTAYIASIPSGAFGEAVGAVSGSIREHLGASPSAAAPLRLALDAYREDSLAGCREHISALESLLARTQDALLRIEDKQASSTDAEGRSSLRDKQLLDALKAELEVLLAHENRTRGLYAPLADAGRASGSDGEAEPPSRSTGSE
jgi:hypothetical protein